MKNMPLLSITSKKTLQLCEEMNLEPNDMFICSYPKSGTTWMQHICISLLMHDKMNMPSERYEYKGHVSDYAPFYEADQHWDLSSNELIQSIQEQHSKLGRRIFNTHLRWEALPGRGHMPAKASANDGLENITDKAKFIYLVRAPLDACVSLFFHLSNQVEGGYDGTFHKFFDEWLEGRIAYGSWIDHLLSFAPAFAFSDSRRDLLLISYEKMTLDLKSVVKQLIAFLDLAVSDEQVEEMLPTFSFSSMSRDLDRFQPRSVSWKNNFKFLRKGKVGDSKTYVSDVQRESLVTRIEQAQLEQKLRGMLENSPNVLETFTSLLPTVP